MSICRPGSASTASLGGTEPDPRPVAMTTTGTNHGCGPDVLQRQSRARVNAGLMVSSGSGLRAQGRGGPGLDNRLRVLVTQARGSAGTGGLADGGAGLWKGCGGNAGHRRSGHGCKGMWMV